MSRVQVWSSGGGVQSATIAALIVKGDIPPPDLAAIVDTEREATTTWGYMDAVIQPALNSVGVNLVRIPKSQFATVDLYSSKGDLLIPAFTTETGKVGKFPTFCSNEWKQRVLRRWVNTQSAEKQFDVWIGISTDELKRALQPLGKWQHRHPLIERRMNRRDCIALVKSMGWPEAPRSSCYICPNRGTGEWKYLLETAPQDFAKAVQFEKDMQAVDEDLWLTQSAKPLAELVDSEGVFTGRCDSGYCFT